MCNCITREFLGRKKEVRNIVSNDTIDLSLCLAFKATLATDTPVTVGTERLESKDDSYCEKSEFYPYLDDTEISIIFDDSSTTKSLRIELIKLVPNPLFLECSHD